MYLSLGEFIVVVERPINEADFRKLREVLPEMKIPYTMFCGTRGGIEKIKHFKLIEEIHKGESEDG